MRKPRTAPPEPLYLDIGQAFLYPDDELGGWKAVLQFDDDMMDLPGVHPTEGAALDALNTWARKRQLLMAGGHYVIRKKNPNAE